MDVTSSVFYNHLNNGGCFLANEKKVRKYYLCHDILDEIHHPIHKTKIEKNNVPTTSIYVMRQTMK